MSLTERVATQRAFLDTQLRPALDAAAAGTGHVLFVDAAHFVYGTVLCCLWSALRVFVRAASGRQRFNRLGAWNSVTRRRLAVTNTTVVNTGTMCDLLRAIAAEGLAGPVTVVLDNARYQRNAAVQALAAELSIRLLFLPSYSPSLNLIERLWGVRRAAVRVRQIPPRVRLPPDGDRGDVGRHPDQARPGTHRPDDSQLTDLRGRITSGRVG